MAAETEPQTGYGTQVTWGGHDIGYLLDLEYSGIDMGTVESSSHESEWKTYLPGMLDGGELTLPIRFIAGDTTGQQQLLSDMKSRTEREVIITLPDATTWTFNALATHFGDFTFPMEGTVDASLTLKVTGEPTFSEE